MNAIRRLIPVKNTVMLHTPLEVLAQQNRLRPRTQSQARDGFPGLRKNSKREPLKAVRTPFVSEVFNPWPEEDENRPETPFVKTRLQRQMLSSGGSRPNVPVDTADVFNSQGMYKRRMTPQKLLDGHTGKNITNNSSRCATPIPIEQPLTRLCWDNKLGGISDDDDSDSMSSVSYFKIQRTPVVLQTPRLRDRSPSRFLKHANDITVSDLESVEQVEKENSALSEPLNLTQKVLQTYFQKKVSSTQRIVRWLADCEEKTRGSTLPSHLPDIMYTCHSRGQMSPISISNNHISNTF